jgi:selenide,water dikinase
MTVDESTSIRLTQFARGGGCAAKLRQRDLSRVLDLVACETRPDVIIDRDHADDAAVVEGTGGRQLVLTADVIAPLVDDPELFGEIAATNAMSDVWAMGGEPRFALNLAFFPDEQLPLDVLAAVLRGGARACARAGVAIVGGHTVRDPELKYGLSVTGEVEPDRVLANRTARAGQACVLTKALGTGVISQAVKKGIATAEEAAAAARSMTTLNRDAVRAARKFDVTACTDVTGFGLLGHLRNILRGSDLAATVDLAALPTLPGAARHARDGVLPGGSRNNREFVTPLLRHGELSADADLALSLATDAQTSGGLLLCVPEASAAGCVAAMRDLGLPAARVATLRPRAADEPPGTMQLVW